MQKARTDNEIGMIEEKLYYCGICATSNQLRLPLRCGDKFAGFCRFCGTGGVFVGYITREEADKRGIEVPTIDELASRPNDFKTLIDNTHATN